MREVTCTCPNCNGKREIRRNKIICPFCDSEWILVDNEPVEEVVEETCSAPVQIRPMLNEKEKTEDKSLGLILWLWQLVGGVIGVFIVTSLCTQGFNIGGVSILMINVGFRILVGHLIKNYTH